MRARGSFSVLVVLAAVVVPLMLAGSAAGATEKVLHNFQGTLRHGQDPMSPLISDASGNLYGTTNLGGDYSVGTVYKLTPNSKGGWTQTVLYSFKGSSDGWLPYSGLVFDALGNLYGTTAFGGTGSCSIGEGCGTVFKLAPNSSGGWTESIVYSFQGGNDGQTPYKSLIFDSAGNLYGTTFWGGTGLYGTVFQLTPTSGGGWTESVLHSFTNKSDGGSPDGSLVFDAAGNLFGTTNSGGSSPNGLVFELSRSSQGTWTESVLYNFAGGTDGAAPGGGPLNFDSAGNLYGTTSRGGGFSGGAGTVFELKSNGNGSWTESVLYSFGMTNGDGLYPDGVSFDHAGNLYGTTGFGGNTGCYSNIGCGVVFELVPSLSGKWTERILHIFSGGADGGIPYAGLIDVGGTLYGTTGYGGRANLGAVFKLSPRGTHWETSTIYWFPGSDGTEPIASLVFDKSGNLYGTAALCGLYQNGAVFKLTPNSEGGWTSSLIHSFTGKDGAVLRAR